MRSTPSTAADDDDDDGDDDRPVAPPPTPTPTPPPLPRLLVDSGGATAWEYPGDRVLLRIHYGRPVAAVEVEIGVGWLAADGTQQVLVGFVRDGTLGQTYAVVRRESDGQIVRWWIAPDSLWVSVIPWAQVNRDYTFPAGVIAAIPLDEQHPQPHQLVRRFDGGVLDGMDNRIFAYSADRSQWRHVPDVATFQALGFYWCDVTAADADFFARITLGPPYPASEVPARSDYPSCRT